MSHRVLRIAPTHQSLLFENYLLDEQDHLDYCCVVVNQNAKLALRLIQTGALRRRYQQTVHPTTEIGSTELSSTTRCPHVEFERRIPRNIKTQPLKVLALLHDHLTTPTRLMVLLRLKVFALRTQEELQVKIVLKEYACCGILS